MNQPFIDKYLTAFENILKIRTPSKNTQANYRSQLLRFANEFSHNPRIATTVQLVEYISKMKSRSQMAQMRSALKILYEEVFRQPKKIPYIPYPKFEQRLPTLPTHEQMLEAINSGNTKHRLMLTMLYGTGVRASELTNMKWKDIKRMKEVNPLSIRVHGKGSKDRILPLSENIYKQLQDYCKEYKLNCKNSDDFIFGGSKPYSVRSVAMVCEQAGMRIGMDLSPHKFRHACMTNLADKGIDLARIQQLCGHENSRTTLIYARLNPVKIVMPV